MLIISYVVRRTDRSGHSTTIELCGQFRDLDHFERFSKVEESRGWKVRSYQIVKETTDESSS